MDIQPFLNRLKKELEGRGFPSAYVQRLLHEWHDHLIDLWDEKEFAMSTGASISRDITSRLGEPNQLADRAVSQYQRRTFAGRHPIVMFLLAPIPLTIVAWIATFALAIGGMELAKWATSYESATSTNAERYSTATIVGAYAFLYGAILVPPIALALFFVRMSRISLRSWPWALASCLLIALLTGMLQSSLGFPSGEVKGHLTLGLGMGPHLFVSPIALMQFGVPLAFGLFALWRARRAMLHAS